MYRSAFVLAVLAACLTTPAQAVSKWLRLTTPHVVVIGEVDERSLTEVGVRFERFHEVFSRQFPKARDSGGVPVTVIVFGSGRGFDALLPVHDGKRVNTSAMFVGRPGASYVSMRLDRGEAAYPIVLHEYTHLLVRTMLGDVPLWFNEGLAEYCSTFAMMGDRHAAIGHAQADHLRLLQGREPALAEFVDVRSDSPLYDERTRRSMFYAQSWAFVYLLLGNADWRFQLPRFFEKQAEGMPTPQAIGDAFGLDASEMERELRQQVQRSAHRPQVLRVADSPDIARGFLVEPMTDAAAGTVQADLLLQMDRVEDAVARAESAVKAAPADPRALAVLGRARLRQGKEDEGRALLERATAGSPEDYLPYYYRALTLLRPDAERGAVAPDAASARTAVPLLERAIAIEPDHADSQYLLGFGRLVLGNGTGALAPLATALRLAHRQEYALTYAEAQIAARDFAAVRPLLTSLSERGASESLRYKAGELLKRVTLLERGSRAPSTVAADPEPAAATPVPTDDPPARPELVLRTLNEDETRVEGSLQAIDCPAGRVVLRLLTNDGPLALEAPRFDAIEFISYRDDLRGDVRCGPRKPPEPVQATWKVVAGSQQKRAVAIEFMPDAGVP